MKREATDRLGKFFNIQHFPNFSVENWGRSKSTRKQAPGNQGQGIYASTSSFQTPVKGQGNTRRSKRRTLYRNNSQFNTQEEENYPYSGENQENKHPEFEQHQQQQKQPYTDKSINDTIALLRRNLQGINIHLGAN